MLKNVKSNIHEKCENASKLSQSKQQNLEAFDP